MAIKSFEKVWHNGEFIHWNDATIHVASHVVSYGSCLFEGIRCYDTPAGPSIFRLQEHTDRLVNSCKIYRMELDFTREQLSQAMVELVQVNGIKHCYIRPVVFRGYGEVGVNPLHSVVEVYMACWRWGAYLGAEALAKGVDVCVSSWTRMAPNTLPAMAKAACNYMNSQLIHMEAEINGFAEGIALDASGHVSEGSGMNIFLVLGGTLITPPLAASILPGITRDSIIKLAGDLNIPVREANIPREMLYLAEEVFFAGTAAEVTPVRSIDRITIGKGVAGPATLRIQEEFFAVTSGKKADRHNWLTPVNAPVAVTR